MSGTSPDSVVYPTVPYGVIPRDQNGFFGEAGMNRLPLQAPFLKWRKAVANVRTGTARAKLLFVGDSTTMGAGAGTGGATNLNAAFPRCFPARVATILNQTFVPCSFNSIWGSQNAPAVLTYSTYDTRTVFGTGWAMSGGGTLGANFIRFTSGGGVATFAFTPTAAFDTITIYYYAAAGQGTFTTDVDGGASLGTTNTATGSGFLSTSFTVSAGTHTININAQNNGSLFISGIIPSLSTTYAVDAVLAGHYGATALNYTPAGSFGPLTALRAYAPDCTVVNLTVNDAFQRTNLSTYRANLATLISAAQESGDVVLMVGAPPNNTVTTSGTLGLYADVVYDLAAQYNCGLVDIYRRWGVYSNISAYFPYYDALHPGNLAYADMAQAVASGLMFQ